MGFEREYEMERAGIDPREFHRLRGEERRDLPF